jgi:oxygen-independent coproporphyrinogen-3 oxidase
MEYKEAYLTALLREMEIRRDNWKDAVFETIYLGGGTPSILQPNELKRLLEGIHRFFTVSHHPEITLEANPDDLTGSYIASLNDLPVNRISIGIQSFEDSELRLLNRRHTAHEAVEARERC